MDLVDKELRRIHTLNLSLRSCLSFSLSLNKEKKQTIIEKIKKYI